jgi:hypothetical protein
MSLNNVGRFELLLCIVLSISLSIFVCLASDRFFNRESRRAEAIEMELAILTGSDFHESGNLTYMPAFQNRILFPLLLRAGASLGIFTLAGWYALLRLFSAFAMFFTFWWVLRFGAGAGIKLAATGLLMLAYCLVFTLSLPLVLTSDFPDAMFTALLIFAAVRHRGWLLLAISLVAAANRESAAFAGIIWFSLHGVGEKWRIKFGEAAFAILVSVLSYSTVLMLRYGFGGPRAVASNTQVFTIKTNLYLAGQYLLHPLSPFAWPSLIACMVAPCVLWLIVNRQAIAAKQLRLLGAAGAIAIASLFFGIISEPRIFIPAVVLLIFAAVWVEARNEDATHQSYS